jgi:hypothetical protein
MAWPMLERLDTIEHQQNAAPGQLFSDRLAFGYGARLGRGEANPNSDPSRSGKR